MKTSDELTEKEKREIVAWCEANPHDPEYLSKMAAKYHCSKTTIGIVLVEAIRSAELEKGAET